MYLIFQVASSPIFGWNLKEILRLSLAGSAAVVVDVFMFFVTVFVVIFCSVNASLSLLQAPQRLYGNVKDTPNSSKANAFYASSAVMFRVLIHSAHGPKEKSVFKVIQTLFYSLPHTHVLTITPRRKRQHLFDYKYIHELPARVYALRIKKYANSQSYNNVEDLLSALLYPVICNSTHCGFPRCNYSRAPAVCDY